MLKTEHREPPNGSHSMASAGHPGREVAVFPGSPGVLAYPSYVVTYMTPLCEDPYRYSMLYLTLGTLLLTAQGPTSHRSVLETRLTYASTGAALEIRHALRAQLPFSCAAGKAEASPFSK